MTRQDIITHQHYLKQADRTPENTALLMGIAVFRDSEITAVCEVWCIYWIAEGVVGIKTLDNTVVEVIGTDKEKEIIQYCSANAPYNMYLEAYIPFSDTDLDGIERLYYETKVYKYMIGECLD